MVRTRAVVVKGAVMHHRRETLSCATKWISASDTCRSSRVLREENSVSALRSPYGSKQPSSGETVPMICRMICFLGLACLITMGSKAQIAVAGSIAAWGLDDFGQVSNTPTGTGFTAIAGGFYHGYALRAEQPPTVPEPSTVVLTGLGAIAVVWRQSCRRTA